MIQKLPPAAPAPLPSSPAQVDPLFAAHAVLERLVHVRFALMDAEFRASDAHFGDIALRLREHIAGINELLPMLTTTVKALEAAGKAVKP
jgi:hypothetical protein